MTQNGATRHPQKSPIYVRGRSAPIGYVTGSVFRKTIRGSVHILHSPRAIAFDRSTIVDAENAGALTVEVTDSDTGNTYRATIADIWRHSFDVRRGFGDQIAYALTRWSVNGAPVAATFESNQAIRDAQLSLFGGGQ